MSGVDELTSGGTVVAPGDEADEACLTRPLYSLQPFERTAGSQVVLDPQVRVGPPGQLGPLAHRAVVDLQKVDIVDPESRQTLIHGSNYMPGDVAQVFGSHLDLRGEVRPHAQLLEPLPEVRLGDARPVVGRLVEVVDSPLERLGDGISLLFGR